MARKVIIDCDPGIDDAVALTLALFEPRLEVLAASAVAGNVPADQATRNIQTVIEQVDPPRYPRVGTATALDASPGVDGRALHGDDGLGNAGFIVSRLHHQHASDKIICDEVRANPEQVTIICLGPLTNIARAFRRDPGVASMIGRLIIAGGSVKAGGDVTAAAEFNMFYDPESARDVFRSATTKTLLPLDVTRQLSFTVGLLQDLPREFTRVGAFLRKLLPHSFRAFRQRLGVESIHLQAVVALLAAVQPELFHTHEMSGDVETRGELTLGATVFDHRRASGALPNMEVALELDTASATDAILRILHAAG